MTQFSWIGLALLAFAIPGVGAQSDRDAIARVVDQYVDSVSRADTVLASKIWLTSPQVSMIHPLGHEHGWTAVKQNVYERIMRDMFTSRELKIRDVGIQIYGGSSLVEFYWDFQATLRASGAITKTAGRESQVYHKTRQGWKLVHVHYSGMPVDGQ